MPQFEGTFTFYTQGSDTRRPHPGEAERVKNAKEVNPKPATRERKPGWGPFGLERNLDEDAIQAFMPDSMGRKCYLINENGARVDLKHHSPMAPRFAENNELAIEKLRKIDDRFRQMRTGFQ